MDKRNIIFFWIVVAVVSLGMLTRLLGLPSNVSPLLAVLIFGAAYFRRKELSLLLPIGLYFLVDLYLNNVVYAEYFEGFTLIGDLGVYLSLLVIIPLGVIVLRKVTIPRVLVSGLGAAVLFYLITNFYSTLVMPQYTKDFSGLMQSYTAAMPFFRSTLVSTLVYCVVFFSAAELYLRQPQLHTNATSTTTIKS